MNIFDLPTGVPTTILLGVYICHKCHAEKQEAKFLGVPLNEYTDSVDGIWRRRIMILVSLCQCNEGYILVENNQQFVRTPEELHHKAMALHPEWYLQKEVMEELSQCLTEDKNENNT